MSKSIITNELNTIRWRPVDLVDWIVHRFDQDRARLTALEIKCAELQKQIDELRTNEAEGISAAIQRMNEADKL